MATDYCYRLIYVKAEDAKLMPTLYFDPLKFKSLQELDEAFSKCFQAKGTVYNPDLPRTKDVSYETYMALVMSHGGNILFFKAD